MFIYLNILFFMCNKYFFENRLLITRYTLIMHDTKLHSNEDAAQPVTTVNGSNIGILGNDAKVEGDIKHIKGDHTEIVVQDGGIIHFEQAPERKEKASRTKAKVHADVFLKTLTINRSDQYDEFFNIYTKTCDENPFATQIFFLHGLSEDSHDKFIDRVQQTLINHYSNDKIRASFSRSKLIKDWPSGKSKKNLGRIFNSIARDLKLWEKIVCLEDLCEKIPEEKVIFYHNIRASKWGKHTRSLIQDYIDFFDTNISEKHKKRFIIFLNVMYESHWLKKRIPVCCEKNIHGILSKLHESTKSMHYTVQVLSKFESVVDHAAIDDWLIDIKSDNRTSGNIDFKVKCEELEELAKKKKLTMKIAIERAEEIIDHIRHDTELGHF